VHGGVSLGALGTALVLRYDTIAASVLHPRSRLTCFYKI